MQETQTERKNKEIKSTSATIYSRCLISRHISIPITQIGKNIQQTIETTLVNQIEGKCIVEGFIKPASLRVISHSSGIVKATNILFEVVFECNACFPVEGTLIECVAKNITKAGIRGESKEEKPSPFVVFVMRDHHYNSSLFNSIKEDDVFTVRVIGQRFELNDPFVSIIGELVQI
jgi:DNA-directed RNA polymerase subunit E'/Rpb7